MAARSPRRPRCSTWWARAAADAPRSSSACEARSCAPSRQAAGRRLVDRPAYERVPEAEAARDVGGADQIEPQQLVELVDRRSRLGRRRGGRELRIERVAGDRGALAAARRAPAESRPSSSVSAAATVRGTSHARRERRAGGRRHGAADARRERASCSR